jgi:bifunctional non-homologous end joining protein LigD
MRRSDELEGIIAKRANAAYVSRRTDDWLKLKCKKRQEFVIAGYVDRAGTTRQIGSLILGVYQSDTLVPAGSVGTGFNAEQATALKTKLAKLEQKEPPFANGAPKPGRWSKRRLGEERWVKPTLVAEVEFAEWTPEGHVRHASFISLRADKAAGEVVRETGTAEG